MKTSKLFTIDTELTEKLKGINGSKLVNGLLTDYFFGGGGLEEEEMKLKIKEIQTEIERGAEKILLIKEKLKTVKVKKEEVKKKFNKIPDRIIEDFRQFPLMTIEALRSRYPQYKGQDWEDLKEAYKEYFNK